MSKNKENRRLDAKQKKFFYAVFCGTCGQTENRQDLPPEDWLWECRHCGSPMIWARKARITPIVEYGRRTL